MALVGPNAAPDYIYKATIVRWVDGDTVWLTVDLGFHLTMTSDFRLYGVNTPEHNQAGFHEATQFAESHAPAGSGITIQSFKDPDKYGRWIVKIFVGGSVLAGRTDLNDASVYLNDALISSGHATPYFGGTKAPVS